MNLRQLLILDEGRVKHAYTDSLGYWTIGVGHCIDKRMGCGLPEPFIDQLLDHDIAEATEIARKYAPWLDTLNEVRQAVLVSAAFVLGHKLAKFDGTLQAIKDERFADAAERLRNTLWARQAPNRVRRLAHMMETGEW